MSNIKKIFAGHRKYCNKIKNFVINSHNILRRNLKDFFAYLKKHPVYFAILIFFLLTISGTFIIYSYLNSYNFYKSQVSQFISPPIEVAGKTYKVSGDAIYLNENRLNSNIGNFFLRLKILRLSFFAIQARIDPLFGIEGQDLDKFNHSLDLLQNSTDGLSNSKNFKDIEFVRNNIMPISFLRQLGKLEAQRRTVASNPTEKTIKEYNAGLAETINKYSDGLENLKKIFSITLAIHPKYQNASIEFIGGIAKFSHYIDIINTLEENTRNKKFQYDGRIACLSGKWKVCEPLKNFFVNAKLSLQNSSLQNASKDNSSADSEYRPQIAIIKQFLKNNGDKYDYDDNLVMGINTDCFQERKDSYFLFSWQKFDQENVFKPRFINNLFFIDLTKNTETIFDVLRERGDRYDWQEETNYYLCPDLTYLGQLDSLYKIRSLLKNSLLDFSGNDADTRELALTANVLANKNVISDANFKTFYSEGLDLFDRYSEVYLAKKIGTNNVLNFEKLLNMYRQNSAGLDDLLIAGYQQNEAFKKNISNIDSKQDFEDNLPYFVLKRSTPSLYFLAFNESVVEHKPSFFSQIRSRSNKYDDLSSIDLSPKEIINAMQDSILLPSLNLKKQKNN
jgi:hypothetical protein